MAHAADDDGNVAVEQAWLEDATADAAHSRRDSFTVPAMPTMDMSEFEALEAEAEKKARRSPSLTPSQQAAASPHLPGPSAAPPSALSLQNIPDGSSSMEASGTPPSGDLDLPQLQMCLSPSLDGPTVCASPQVPGGGASKASKGEGSQVEVQVAQPPAAAPAQVGAGACGTDSSRADVDAKSRAIKNALVNQSLTGESPRLMRLRS